MGATGPKPRRHAANQAAVSGGAGTEPGTAASRINTTFSAAGGVLRRTFEFPSDFAATRDVQLAIMTDVESSGFDDDAVFAIRISLEEAIVNAIRHGNRFDVSKRVRVVSEVRQGRAEITVEDEGVGFDRAKVADPTHEENLCRPNGRGILLIESYMTQVKYDQGGRRLFMAKDAAQPTT